MPPSAAARAPSAALPRSGSRRSTTACSPPIMRQKPFSSPSTPPLVPTHQRSGGRSARARGRGADRRDSKKELPQIGDPVVPANEGRELITKLVHSRAAAAEPHHARRREAAPRNNSASEWALARHPRSRPAPPGATATGEHQNALVAARARRHTMFAPIRPSPIIPIPQARHVSFQFSTRRDLSAKLRKLFLDGLVAAVDADRSAPRLPCAPFAT